MIQATWYEGTAQLLSLTELKSHLFLRFIVLAEPLTDEGGEETGVPGENPWWRASENATYYSPKIQAPSETQTRTIALVAGKESRRANCYTMCCPLHTRYLLHTVYILIVFIPFLLHDLSPLAKSLSNTLVSLLQSSYTMLFIKWDLHSDKLLVWPTTQHCQKRSTYW